MKTFEQWYNKINEEIAEPTAVDNSTEAVAEPVADVHSDRDAMISDVDAIMTSLETLASELREELNTEELNEADTEIGALANAGAAAAAGAGITAVWISKKIKAAKARKGQKKVNSILMKIELAKIKVQDTENENAKEALRARIEALKEQAASLQELVSTRFADSEYATKAMNATRLEGNIERSEFLAKETGSKTFKEQLAKYRKQHAETMADLDQIEKEAERKSKEAEKKDSENQPDEPKDSTEQDDSDNVEDTENDDSDAPEKNSKEDMLQRLDTMLKQAQDAGNEERVKKVQDLIDKVSARESWQLNNTYLGQLLESEIVKLESDQMLSETLNISIKDKFSKLM